MTTSPEPMDNIVRHTLSPTSMEMPDEDGDLPRGRPTSPGATSPNARSQTITVADGEDTHGVINMHPSPTHIPTAPFRVGVSEDRNKKCRRTMEDAHAFVYDFGSIRGQGFFAVFDGHAGKHAAEWCGQYFHEYLLAEIRAKPEDPVPDLLNSTFHVVDAKLSELAAQDGTHSGCTAVTAFLRLEDPEGRPIGPLGGAGSAERSSMEKDLDTVKRRFGDGVHREKLREMFHRRTSSNNNAHRKETNNSTGAATPPAPATPPKEVRRVLYTANVGDARAVLCRGGKAVRLTYDHKGTDAQEVRRITEAGGFVMNNRVNGVLAVTRSLGDAAMKEFIVGSPYTTETTLTEEDSQLIIACDGLWDVCEDQEAVNIIKDIPDPQQASRALLDHALSAFSTDNLSVLVISLTQPTKS